MKKKFKVPFDISKIKKIKELNKSVSKSYWTSTAAQVKEPEYQEAVEKFMKVVKTTSKKKPQKAKMYLVCCLNHTDGEPSFTYLDAYSIKKLGLLKDPDCTFIDGKIIDRSQVK